ncbi:hypothetical protein KPN2242_18460 [Klebsiella pneumoniae KCTC 2242]|nr:hypothetical protein KPN2242_18460 [Klebsiella pneumoniae KCTC 2242]
MKQRYLSALLHISMQLLLEEDDILHQCHRKKESIFLMEFGYVLTIA